MSNSVADRLRRIKHRIDPSNKGRRACLIDNPPVVDEHSIVFTSTDDYSGNPKALFLYMIENGYNEKYHITWLFEKRHNYRELNIPNVKSINMFTEDGERSWEAQQAILSAKYVFYSHNVNWAKVFRDEQLFIDLWHGCGYKGDLKSDTRQIYFDYCMVTGDKYIDIFKDVLHKPDGNILALGYPRNDMLFANRSQAKSFVAKLKKEHDANSVVIWMPTYRQSNVKRLDTDTGVGELGLPLVYSVDDLKRIDECCAENKLVIILKQHLLQKDYAITSDMFTNIVLMGDPELSAMDVDLYELMGNTDGLITDYSSVAIDYMLVNKPLAYILEDYERYEQARGFSFENVKESMPGDHVYNIADLESFIEDVSEGQDRHKEWRDRVKKEVLTESDCYCRDILNYFEV